MKTLAKYISITLLIFLVGCVSEEDLDQPTANEENLVTEGPMKGLNVTDDFNYATTQQVGVSLTVPQFLEHAVFQIYSKTGQGELQELGKATFDNASFYRELTLPAAADSLIITSVYVGLTKEVRLAINIDQLHVDYRDFYVNTSAEERPAQSTPDQGTNPYDRLTTTFSYLGAFDNQGVPTTMETPDVIDALLLDDINNSLPEAAGGIPNTHPEFLAGKETEIVLTQDADVWVTFVAEGAGHKNALGFYSYPLGNPPASESDIADHTIVFSNASMVNSGGGLVPGDKVHLGFFQANTVISWFLVANGWNGNGVKSYAQKFYADPNLNPENTPSLKDHMVLLHDQARDLNIFGFEDLHREDGYSDEDFNDAIFYVTSNPVTAISTSNVAVLDAANDSDGDGINDALDEFPYDVNLAFNNFYPSNQNSGTLVFEDLWPSTGDYDFNDLVLNYDFNLIANGNNLISRIEADFSINHIGASFENGLAFVLPINPSNIATISGQALNGGYEQVHTNGTELGTEANETVVYVCGNVSAKLGETISLVIDFATPQDVADLGIVPFNSFLIVNGDRGREVHLPDLSPTSKATDLGTIDDYSDANNDRYYKTKKNLPWALNVFDNFVPPSEQTSIISAYPKFKNWANSGGTIELEWYNN